MGCAALRFWAIGGAAHLHMDTKHADRRSNCLRPLLSHAMAEVRARQQVGGGGGAQRQDVINGLCGACWLTSRDQWLPLSTSHQARRLAVAAGAG